MAPLATVTPDLFMKYIPNKSKLNSWIITNKQNQFSS